MTLAAASKSRDDSPVCNTLLGNYGNNMNHKHLLMASLLASLAACASSGPQRVASVTQSIPPHVVASPAVGASAKPAIDDPRIAESEKLAKELGYHVVDRDGARFYCRTVAPMGTRIPQKECLRSDAMQQEMRRREEDKMNIRQFQYCGPNCVPPPNAQ